MHFGPRYGILIAECGCQLSNEQLSTQRKQVVHRYTCLRCVLKRGKANPMGTSQGKKHPRPSFKSTVLRFAIVTSAAVCLAGCQARPKDDPSAKTSPEEFKNKFKEIQLDMSERQVDQILAGYPCERRQLAEDEKEKPPNPYSFNWKVKRKGSFVKSYDCRPDANERSLYAEVYFDDNCSVVGKLLVGDEFLSKCSKIQLDMTEEQVDQILAGHPCQRRELFDHEKEEAGFAGRLKRKGSFVKTYDSVLHATEGNLYIDVYFDDNYTVVGKYVGEYIS
jgi:hypothetical protein